MVNYYEMNKETIKQRQAGYYEMNKETIKQRQAGYYKFNIHNKRYRCEICDFSFGNNSNFQKHLKTSKHFWKYIYSVD